MRWFVLIALLALGTAPYCEGRDVYVAAGGNYALTPDDLRLEIRELGPSYAYKGTIEDRKGLVDVLSTRFFLSEEAIRMGMGDEGLVEAEASAAKGALADAYRKAKIEAPVRVPRVASKPALDELDRRLHLREMTFAVYAIAEEALADMRAGTSFDAMAASVEGRPDIRVTDLGLKYWREIDRTVAYEAYQLHVGEISGIVPVKSGYSIFYLVEDKVWGESPELIRLRSKKFVRAIKEADLERSARAELSRLYDVKFLDAGVNASMQAFSMAFAGSRPPDSLLAREVVTYRGNSLNVAYLLTFFLSLPAQSQPYVGDAHAIQEFALDTILPDLEAAAGRSMGLDRLPLVIWSSKKAREEYLMPKMEEYFRNQVTLGPDDALNYFNENRPSMVTSRAYRASRILVDSRESAQAVIKEIRSGRGFGDVARERSLDKYTSAKGGDLGFLDTGIIASYDSALADLKPGDIARPFESAEGFEILKLEELSESRPITFEEARASLEAHLVDVKANEILSAWVAARKQEVGYRVSEDLLTRLTLPEPEWKKTIAKESPVAEEPES
jgi:parvulin-like peptidyl-prolyl isomerase